MGRVKLFNDFDPYDELVRLRILVEHQQARISNLERNQREMHTSHLRCLNEQNLAIEQIIELINQKS